MIWPAMKSDQTKGEVLLVKWIAESIWPFIIGEDNGFLNFVDFLQSALTIYFAKPHESEEPTHGIW